MCRNSKKVLNVIIILTVIIAVGCGKKKEEAEKEKPKGAIKIEPVAEKPEKTIEDIEAQKKRFKVCREIINASKRGDVDEVKRLLDDGCDIEFVDEVNNKPLMWAVCKGHLDVVKLLLERGANIEAVDATQCTALTWGATSNQPEAVKLLLDKGARLNDEGMRAHRSLLDWAAYSGYADIVEILIKRGFLKESPEASMQALGTSIFENRGDIAKLIIEGGLDLNIVDEERNFTILMFTVEKRKADLVTLLLENGADVNIINKTYGETALDIATLMKNKQMQEKLRTAGGKTAKELKDNQKSEKGTDAK